MTYANGRAWRVQEVRFRGSPCGYRIYHHKDGADANISSFLAAKTRGTSRTYAYAIANYLEWLESNQIAIGDATLDDLSAYFGLLSGSPEWNHQFTTFARPRSTVGDNTLRVTAAAIKALHIHLGHRSINTALADSLKGGRLNGRPNKGRGMLTHLGQNGDSTNILLGAPRRQARGPLPPPGAATLLLQAAREPRDKAIVAWLADSGMRVGELCSLQLQDLHLRAKAECGEVNSPHFHVCHREGLLNGASVKTKWVWHEKHGLVTGGSVRVASPLMVEAYFDWITSPHPRRAHETSLLTQLSGPSRGEALSTAGVRAVLRRLSTRAGLTPPINPHSFRHQWATDLMRATGGDAEVVSAAGGWRGSETVLNTYTHPSLDNAHLRTALESVWKSRGENF